MWDIATARLRHSLTGHTGKVVAVACSPADPHLAASCGSDRAIKVRAAGCLLVRISGPRRGEGRTWRLSKSSLH